MDFRFSLLGPLMLLSLGLISCKEYDLNKINSLIFTQDPKFKIEVGIFGKLLEQWLSRTSIPDQIEASHIQTGKVTYFEDIKVLNRFILFDLDDDEKLKKILQLEDRFGTQFLNLNPWIRFTNLLRFNICIWYFDEKVDEFWTSLNEASRDFIEDVFYSAAEISSPQELSLIEAINYVRKREEADLIDEPSFHSWRRWISMSAAFHIFENREMLDLKGEPQMYLKQYYDKLLDDTCAGLPREMSEQYIELLDQIRSEYQIGRNTRWIKLNTICTLLDRDFQAVFTYYMSYLHSREFIKHQNGTYSLYKRVFEKLDRPLDVKETALIRGASMNPRKLLGLRPTQTKKLLQRWLDSQSFIEFVSRIRIFKDNLLSLASISEVNEDKCNRNSLAERFSVLQKFPNKPYNNVQPFFYFMNVEQKELCERLLKSRLRRLLKNLNVPNLVQLESLRQLLLDSIQPAYNRESVHIYVPTEPLKEAIAMYFFLQDAFQQRTIRNFWEKLNNNRYTQFELSLTDLDIKICQGFRNESLRLGISQISSDLHAISEYWRDQEPILDLITRQLLTYDQICMQVQRASSTKIKASDVILRRMNSYLSSHEHIFEFLRGDSNQ